MRKNSNNGGGGGGVATDTTPAANPTAVISKSKQKKQQQQLLLQQQQQQQQQQQSENESAKMLKKEMIEKALIDVDIANDELDENHHHQQQQQSQPVLVNGNNNKGKISETSSSRQPTANNLEEIDLNVNSLTDVGESYNDDHYFQQAPQPQPPVPQPPIVQQQPSSLHANIAHQHHGGSQHVQLVHPVIQTVQPYPNSLQRNSTTAKSQLQQQQQQPTSMQIQQPSPLTSAATNVNKKLQINSLDANETTMLSLDSSSNTSLFIDKQAMLIPQNLDNTAIQKLINDEVKSYLILDDKEALQVKSSQEFVSLFKSTTTTSATNSSNRTSSVSDAASSSTSSSSSSSTSTSLYPSLTPTFTSLGQVLSSNSSQPNDDKLVKCVSIFGNTGDGKSHTLNQTFFNGRHIFRTSEKQETCTMGVWCAYDSLTNSLIFDTEGLLGTTCNENKRMRLLLKVLAVSDVIIYRTRAERLHNDLFKFLSDASVAYLKYFSKELKAAAVKLKLDTISSLGPDCVIFHETQHTDILCDEFDADGHERTVSHHLRDRFAKLDLSYNAFSSIEYVGTRTSFMMNAAATAGKNMNDGRASTPIATDFTKLVTLILVTLFLSRYSYNFVILLLFFKAQTVRYLLKNNSVRPPRKLSSIYHVLKVLNDKFNGVITKNQISTFADEYFTCTSVCLSCG
jgi:hypothetical protein